jgi:hypothetical protein
MRVRAGLPGTQFTFFAGSGSASGATHSEDLFGSEWFHHGEERIREHKLMNGQSRTRSKKGLVFSSSAGVASGRKSGKKKISRSFGVMSLPKSFLNRLII